MNPAAQIRELLAHGMTQKEIAEAIGVKQPTVSRIVTGAQSDTRASIARRIEALYASRVAGKEAA